jgi:hypothetical protein
LGKGWGRRTLGREGIVRAAPLFIREEMWEADSVRSCEKEEDAFN